MGVNHLQRAFHRFCTGIAEETPIKTADFREPFSQAALILVIVEIGRVQQKAGLLADYFRNTRMSMPERIHANTVDQIEVTVAFEIVDVAALTAMKS